MPELQQQSRVWEAASKLEGGAFRGLVGLERWFQGAVGWRSCESAQNADVPVLWGLLTAAICQLHSELNHMTSRRTSRENQTSASLCRTEERTN